MGELAAKFDAQTAALDTANGRTSDVVAIVGRCDVHMAAAATALGQTRPWWKLWAK